MSTLLQRQSERLYASLVHLYPPSYQREFAAEMQYVFAETLKDAYKKHGNQGIITVWSRTSVDFGKSLIMQYIEDQKRSKAMKTKNTNMLMKNKDIAMVVGGTALLLSIPFFSMLLGGSFNWDETDFIIIGLLLLIPGLTFVFIARQVKDTTHKVMIGLAVLALIMLIWAELAVGIFGTPFAGS